MPHRAAGFTLVELMIGIAIAALLVVLAIPSYQVWVADAQIRNAAESIADGMRYAQSQAIARNSTIEFIIDPTTGTGGWRARLVIDGSIIQTATLAEGSNLTAMRTFPAGANTVTFTSLGGIALANADASPILTEVDVTTATSVSGTRNLNVLVGAGRAGIKLCDPKWPATDPKGCPP